MLGTSSALKIPDEKGLKFTSFNGVRHLIWIIHAYNIGWQSVDYILETRVLIPDSQHRAADVCKEPSWCWPLPSLLFTRTLSAIMKVIVSSRKLSKISRSLHWKNSSGGDLTLWWILFTPDLSNITISSSSSSWRCSFSYHNNQKVVWL